VGEGWALEFESFLGPVKWHQADSWALEFESFLGPVKWHQVERRVPFGVQNIMQGAV
jgi:hypothetical protein